MHVQMGSIKSHLTEVHRVKPTSAKLLETTKVIFRAQPKQELILAKRFQVLLHIINLLQQMITFTRSTVDLTILKIP